MRGARDTRAAHTVEGQRIPQLHPRSWAHRSARGSDGNTRLPRAETGGWLCPTTVAGASGREGSGKRAGMRCTRRREAATPHHPRRRRFWTAPAAAGMGSGRGSREGAGTGEDTRRRCRSRKFSITAVVPPPPSGSARHCPPAARRGGAGAADPLRRLPRSPGARRAAAAPHLLPFRGQRRWKCPRSPARGVLCSCLRSCRRSAPRIARLGHPERVKPPQECRSTAF